MDNGPESSGVRTQLLKRIVELVDQIGKPIHLLYYPPDHSKYNPTLARLGDSRQALEWSKTDECSDHAAVGTEPDLERPSSHGEVKSQDLSDRHFLRHLRKASILLLNWLVVCDHLSQN